MAAFVLVAGAQIVRTAVARSDGFGSGLAGTIAASHPSTIRAEVMTAVGESAARGEYPPAEALRGLERLARAEPLAPEPFLVHGAIALKKGDVERAERLLVEARHRSPRAPAARYLLADLYLRTGRTLPAMVEMSVLNRLIPNASLQLAPALAEYAKTPGAERQLAAIVSAYPELGPALLGELAGDARNAELVLFLAERSDGESKPADWQEKLIATLIDAGDYDRARETWERLSGVRAPRDQLFNPGFDASAAPPPFNWQLAEGAGGVADASSGGLQVLYYGREDLDLAGQTLLLPPGRYRLSMTLSGKVGDPRSLRWTVSCMAGERRLLDLVLPTGSEARRVAGTFSVPPDGCTAQRLTLSAVGREFPKEAEFRISALQLEKAGSR